MGRLLEQCEEVILEKYLELRRLHYLDSRIAWLISDESHFSKESSCFKCSDLFRPLHYFNFTRINIVGTSV